MNDQLNTVQGGIDRGDVEAPASGLIEIRIAARAEMIATVRTVASDVASRADFDLDTVSDVRMAVDEACTQIAAHADPDYQLRVTFRVYPDRCLRVTITARARPGRGALDTSGFGWRVMSTLADEVVTDSGAGPGGDEVVVSLVKKDA